MSEQEAASPTKREKRLLWERAYRDKNREKLRERGRLLYRRKRTTPSGRAMVRKHHLKAKFGMTPDDYRAMHDVQGGACAICGCPETETYRGRLKCLAVDHCHATGRTRNLLCGRCNKMLGNAKDNPDTLRAAADYLERHASV